MKTLCVAVAVTIAMTIATASPVEPDYPAVPRSVAGQDDVRLLVEELSWPQLCRYSVSEPRDEGSSLVYRKDTYSVYRECIGPRSSPSPAVYYTLPGVRLDPRR